MSPALLQAEVMSQGLVFRNAPALWVVILLIVPAVLAFTVVFYRMGREGSPLVRGLLAALRILVLLLVILLLMDPALETLVVERKPTLTVVLADVSASMAHRDDYAMSPALDSSLRAEARIPEGVPLDTYSRFDLLRRVLDDPEAPFLETLMKEHRLRLYAFGERLQGVSSLRELEARDHVTALGGALQRILEEPEVKSNPVGGIVLLSDGKNTVDPSPEVAVELARKRKIPIYAVGVGDPQALKDIELLSVLAPSVALVDDLITFELRVRQLGFDGQRVEIRLLEGENLVHRQMENLLPTAEDQEFRLLYQAATQGTHQWVVEVKPLPGEHTTENNRQTVEVTVKNERLKVLYVDTLPRWEYRTLKDFLTRGAEAFISQCFLLEADRGFPQETTPGIPSLLRLPETEEEVFFYDVIIFGDVDPEKLGDGDPERARRFMQLVRKFVEDGGGFAMVAGDRFGPQAYRDTPIGEILPVEVDPTESGSIGGGSERGFKVKLTELGRHHPIMQLLDDPERNQAVWEGRVDPLALKEVFWFAPVKKAKPGAMVLAVHESARNVLGPYAILVAGTYGEGPVVFSALDETWRWYWWQGPYLHHRFWGNVVRHLARTRLFAGDRRFRLMANRSEYQAGERIILTAYVKDKTFRPAEKEEQEIILRLPDRTERREKLPRVEAGKFELTLIASDLGEYQAWIPPEDGVTDEKISPVSFKVVISDVERREPVLDEATLQTLAGRTGGRYCSLAEARKLLGEVAQGTVEIPRQHRFRHIREEEGTWLRILPIVFVGLLTAEWILRKRHRFL